MDVFGNSVNKKGFISKNNKIIFTNDYSKKAEILKKHINKFSIIIASLILVPLIMVYRNPFLFYAIGWSIVGPFLITVIVHSIYLAWKNQYSSTKRAKNKGKTKSILNDDFYYGYSGTLLAAYLIGFIQPY